jgi:hypothetical protein
MLIELTKEQLNALEMLSSIGDRYIDDMEPSNFRYEDDKENITQAQDVIQQIQQQFCEVNQVLISAQNLDNTQKMRLINALIDDVCTTSNGKIRKGPIKCI